MGGSKKDLEDAQRNSKQSSPTATHDIITSKVAQTDKNTLEELMLLNKSRFPGKRRRRQKFLCWKESILVIRKTRETDVGEYKCEAKNYLGSAHAITRVVLAKKTNPSRPTSKPQSSSSAPSKPVATTPTTLWPLPSTACPFDSYCLNGGTCSYYETIGEFVCQCAEGYKGQRCDTKDISTSGSMYLSYFCIFGSINPPYPCS